MINPIKPTYGTRTDIGEKEIMEGIKNIGSGKSEEEKCKEKGGIWDPITKTCQLINNLDNLIEKKKKDTEEKNPVSSVGVPLYTSKDTGEVTGFESKKGSTFLRPPGMSNEEWRQLLQDYEEKERPVMPEEIGESAFSISQQREQLQQAQQAQRLVGQVGEFSQLPTENQPLQDWGQAASQGIVGAIPKALSYAVAGAGVGLAGGTAVAPGIGTAGGAVIGAVAGFVSGIASGMISEFKSQRTDTINAQKRVLDEGKQNLNDWATLAASDPANSAFYVNQYNLQLSQISQAYRQMKYDTQRDLVQFEKALPDLAEFEAFYSTGGEMDTLNLKMQTALLSPSSPEYQMLELANRRNK